MLQPQPALWGCSDLCQKSSRHKLMQPEVARSGSNQPGDGRSDMAQLMCPVSAPSLPTAPLHYKPPPPRSLLANPADCAADLHTSLSNWNRDCSSLGNICIFLCLNSMFTNFWELFFPLCLMLLGKDAESQFSGGEMSEEVYACLPCREGCSYCTDDTPCYAQEDKYLRLAIISFQTLCMLLDFISMLLVYRFRKAKVT